MDGEERPTKIRKLSGGGPEHASCSSAGNVGQTQQKDENTSPLAEEGHDGVITSDKDHVSSADLPLESAPSHAQNGMAPRGDDDSTSLSQLKPHEASVSADAKARNQDDDSTEASEDRRGNDVPDSSNQDDQERTTSPTHLPSAEEVAPISRSIGEGAAPLSKNQQKKLRKKEEWESKRDERKVIRKEKVVAKRERKRARHQEQEGETNAEVDNSRRKHPPNWRPTQLPITIVIDCDFDDLMRDNERISLGSQVTRCYSDNKNAMLRAHLTICSFGGKLKERYDGILNKHYQSWKGVRFLESDFVDAAAQAKVWMSDKGGGELGGAFKTMVGGDEESIVKAKDAGEIIYLSSDASETLYELKPYSTYIIGGLVDKNREKGICHKRAVEKDVKTARLPIGEYMDMTSRKVLTTNHVHEIMLKWLECGDWGTAFMSVIPKRKGGQLKSQDQEDELDNAD